MRTLGRGAAPAELDPGDAGDVSAARAFGYSLCGRVSGQNPRPSTRLPHERPDPSLAHRGRAPAARRRRPAPAIPPRRTRPTPDPGRSAPPAALAAAFERAAAAGARREQALAAGQIHALRDAPAFGAVLLDRWLPQAQQWQGWLVTPDPAYAGSTDLVLEARDGLRSARRHGLLRAAAAGRSRPARRLPGPAAAGAAGCGALAGRVRPRRGRRQPAAARRDRPHGRAGRLRLDRHAAGRGERRAQRVPGPAGPGHGPLRHGAGQTSHHACHHATGSAGDRCPPPRAAANQPRWLRSFAAVAATLAVVQAGLLLWRFGTAATPCAPATARSSTGAAAAPRGYDSAYCSAPRPARPRSATGCASRSCRSWRGRTPWVPTSCRPPRPAARCRNRAGNPLARVEP